MFLFAKQTTTAGDVTGELVSCVTSVNLINKEYKKGLIHVCSFRRAGDDGEVEGTQTGRVAQRRRPDIK